MDEEGMMANESRGSGAGVEGQRPQAQDAVADGRSAAEQAGAGPVLGGMALRDGVLLQSDRHWAAAVRLPDGTLRVRSGPRRHLPGARAFSQVPVARGVVRLGEAVSVLPALRREMGLPVLPQEDPRLLAAAAGSAAATLLLRSSRRGSPLLRELGVAALTLGPALLAIRDSELSRMHGAEHKSVGAYEAGTGVEEASKEHVRCGSNLIGPLLATSTMGNLVLSRLGKEKNPLAVLVAGLVSIGSAVELFAWMSRHQGHPLADLLRAPGLRVQKVFTTREPTSEQLDVAQAALAELLRLEGVA
jgi:hypothetical protein